MKTYFKLLRCPKCDLPFSIARMDYSSVVVICIQCRVVASKFPSEDFIKLMEKYGVKENKIVFGAIV
jgi:hypothetical protein